MFDVAGSNAPAQAERMVATAFPRADPELLVLVRARLSGSRAGRGPETGGPLATDPRALEGLRTSLAESRRRLAPQSPGILEWSVGGPDADEADTAVAALESLRTEGEIAGWSLRLAPDRETLGPQLARYRPKLFSTELSLLDPSLTRYLESEARTAEFGTFVRDPFANGLLDGTRFSSALSDRTPRTGPVDVRALRTEFSPVLRLGYLSTGNRRTLAQSALQYLLPRSWVTSILVPLPRPERWEDVFGAAKTAPLSVEELLQVESGTS